MTTGNAPKALSGGTLTAARRKRLPSEDFALPGKGAGPGGKGSGAYPIPNESHARNALARAAQHATPAEQATIRHKVHEKFPGIKLAHPEHAHAHPTGERAHE